MTGPVPADRPVLVARPAGRGDALISQLTAAGLVVEHRPFVTLELASGEELAPDLAHLADGAFTHLVVTSRTTVEALTSVGRPLQVAGGTRVVAVGGGTARDLAAAGAPADVIASGSGADLVEELPAAVGGDRVWLPASAAAAATVPEGLEAKGYRVRRTVAYRPRVLEQPVPVSDALGAGEYAVIVLTSPMIARAAAAIGVHASTAVVSIGRPTSAAAREAGLRVDARAAEPTDEDLARAVHVALEQDHRD